LAEEEDLCILGVDWRRGGAKERMRKRMRGTMNERVVPWGSAEEGKLWLCW